MTKPSLLSRVWKAVTGSTSMSFPRPASWFFGLTESAAADHRRAVGDGLDSNVVVAPILWIARTFPEAVPAVRWEETDGTVEVDRRHSLAELLRRPNPFYSAITLWIATLLSFLVSGNAYWKKVRLNGKVVELWYLPHWMVSPVGDANTYVQAYEYKPNERSEKIDPKDIVHFRYGMDPEDMRLGYAPLRPLLAEVFSDDEAARLVAALLKNRGVPGLLISPEKDVEVGVEDREDLKTYVKEKFTGKRRGEPMILSAAVKVQTFGFSPSELDLSALRNVSEERVCAVFGLPAAVVGFGTGLETTKVGATMREMVRLAWTACLRPLQRMMAADLTLQLLPDFETDKDAEVFFDDSQVEALQVDALAQAQAVREAVTAGVMMRSEGRKKLGLDTVPADDVFLVPIGFVETPRGGAEALPEPVTPEPPKGAKRMTRLQARILRARDSSAKRRAVALERKVRAFLADYGAEVERLFLQQSKDAGDELRVERLFSSLNVSSRRKELRGLLASEWLVTHKENLDAITAVTGTAIGLPDSVQVEILARGGGRANLVDLDQRGKERMNEILAQAREEQLGVAETARRLADAVPAGPFLSSATRAGVIARTEIREAQTQSSLLVYRAMEGVNQVMVIDGRLGPTDADCEDMNGQVMDFQAAAEALAEEHPNGTRDIVPVFQEA